MKRSVVHLSGVAVLALMAGALAPGASTQASGPLVVAAPAAQAAPILSALGDDAVAIARTHLAEHAVELGLSAEDMDQLSVSSVTPTAHNGLTNVYFQQRVNRLDVSGAMLNVAVTAQGDVLRVATNAVAGADKLANSAKPAITDVAAARSAATALGLTPTESFASGESADGVARERELGDGGISSSPVSARLVYAETEQGTLRLAWELVIDQVDGEHWWQIRMDAQNGAELEKNDWVSADSHNVYPLPVEAPTFASPAAPADGRTVITNPATSASPFGWNDTNGVTGPESTLTLGNNVKAYTDTDKDDLPDAGSSPDGGQALDFDFDLDLSQDPSTYRPAAVSNLYFTNNRIHDVTYRFGFDEAAGNFQMNNYGHGGAGNDAVNAEAQDGKAFNNANFGTPADGSAPRMQMYVWNLSTPNRDGDLDNGIIIHEYAHGISSRLTGGAAAPGCLGGDEQAGEGWSDFFSYMLTMPNGTEPSAGRGIGTYPFNQPTTGLGIRTQRYSTNTTINTETYDSIKGAVAPHGVGEVWAEMLWEVAYAMIAKYGFTADLVNGNAGNTKAIQLVMDGLKLQPCKPGFVDARDAIIAADQIDNAGANECLLWKAFAKRGLGYSAVQGSSSSKTDGTQASDLPPYCNGLRVVRTGTASPVTAGTQITYGFALTNTRDAGNLDGVSVKGVLGNHASYVAGSATCGGAYDSVTRTVTFPVGTMLFGASQPCEFKALIDPAASATASTLEDFEPDLAGWTVSHTAGTEDWKLSTTGAHSPTHAAWGIDPSAVSDQRLVLTAPVTVAAGDELSFWHQWGFEAGWDGGVVEVSTDGGTTWADIGAAAFLENGYNGTLGAGVGNPLAGRKAFTGSQPSVRSVASLAAYAGQTIRLRFRVGSDDNIGGSGWFVDDVTIGKNMSTTSPGSASASGLATQVWRQTTTIVPAVAPGAPTVTGSTPAAGSVAVAFTPGPTGLPATSGYTAECVSTDGGVTGALGGAASPIAVLALSAGKSYHCHVKATNGVLSGLYSGFGPTVLVPLATADPPPATPATPTPATPATAPGAPVITKAEVISSKKVKITFGPGATGGSPVTSYAVTCTGKQGAKTKSQSGPASPITVKGLTPGKKYTCVVKATNAVGTGPASAKSKKIKLPRGAKPRAAVAGRL